MLKSEDSVKNGIGTDFGLPESLFLSANMDCNSTQISYGASGYFSKIIVDYIEGSANLSGFYKHRVNMEGMAASIKAREHFATDRSLLVQALTKQYQHIETSGLVLDNIKSLNSAHTFTICTAHQPVIFTGTLYFIYKILHVIKLAKECELKFPGKHFVPVFYMGSEDADLEELGKIYMDGEKIIWQTKQKGAVGRMKTTGLSEIITALEGQISIHEYGGELIKLFRDTYLSSPDIQTATFRLLNILFKDYGLIILVPDNADLKRAMLPVFEDDLFNQTPSIIVEKTARKLGEHYKVQANPRSINLFYLKDDIRELISFNGSVFEVRHTDLRFTEEQLRKELNDHPERFSPNVILRGLFQETILPNIAFIGGGGETAYWLELKDLFDHYQTPFPMLVLRNSFLIVEKKWAEKLKHLGISTTEIFQPAELLINKLVKKNTDKQLDLSNDISAFRSDYLKLKKVSESIDQTLVKHVAALEARAIKAIETLEKKLLKAEKRRFEAQNRQVTQVKSALFPLNGLQERIDNFIPWYSKHGKAFLETIYNHSLSLEQQFVILEEKG
ncbi:bacillithiol biosynthesis cysteine-adding enzyme BshC [Flavitalea antarctica]